MFLPLGSSPLRSSHHVQRAAPYFNAFSFPLARANEYQADATSIRLTSPRTAAEALTGVNIIGSYLSERYWPRILQHADEQPQPCFTPYFSMGHRLAVELDDTTAQGWLDHALARQPTFYDTHPTLSERLKAIGEPPQLAPPAPDQAADRLLGEALQDITACFDRRWQDNILPAWQERHRHVQEGRCKLAELNERHAHNPDLSLQDAYERARLTEAIGGDAEAALSQFHTLHARAPDDAIICLALGARLLARNDDSGCSLIQRAMQLDAKVGLQGCELLRDYHWRNGRQDEAHAWHQQFVEQTQRQQAAEKERSQITLRDKFEPHDLSESVLLELRDQLRAIPGIRKAYYLKKNVKHFTHRPCYVLGFSVIGSFQLYRQKRVRDALQAIKTTVQFPGETLILNIDGDNYRFGRKFRWIRGAQVL